MTHRTLASRWEKRGRQGPPLLLAIDNGTSGLGVLAVDALQSEKVAESKAVKYAIYHDEIGGSIKCWPLDAVEALKTAMQQLRENLEEQRESTFGGADPLGNVVGVGVVGHMHAGIWMGELGLPVDLASMWNCPSAHDDGLALTKRFGQRVARRLTLSHVRKELRTRADWWKASVYSITTPAGFLTWWLTGVNAVGPGEYSGMGLLDPATGNVSQERLSCLGEEFGVDLTSYAPRCVKPGQGFLQLNTRGLQTLGLPPGTDPVVMAGEGDQIGATQYFGLQAGEASGSFGTSGPINCAEDRVVQDRNLSTDNFRLGPDTGVLNMGLIVVCGEPIERCADRHQDKIPEADKKKEGAPFIFINGEASKVAMDCDGALRIELDHPEEFLGLTKAFSASHDVPDPLTPGMDAQLAYLQTALLTRHRLEQMDRGRANRPARFIVGGGPTQSDRFLKTLATALDMTVEVPEGADEATALGLAQLIAYEEEAMACRREGKTPPPIDAFLAEVRGPGPATRKIPPVSDEWVKKLDAQYQRFVQMLP